MVFSCLISKTYQCDIPANSITIAAQRMSLCCHCTVLKQADPALWKLAEDPTQILAIRGHYLAQRAVFTLLTSIASTTCQKGLAPLLPQASPYSPLIHLALKRRTYLKCTGHYSLSQWDPSKPLHAFYWETQPLPEKGCQKALSCTLFAETKFHHNFPSQIHHKNV